MNKITVPALQKAFGCPTQTALGALVGASCPLVSYWHRSRHIPEKWLWEYRLLAERTGRPIPQGFWHTGKMR